jgi:hypothetical protein
LCRMILALLFFHAGYYMREAGVDIGDFTGNAARQIRQQEGGGVADIIDRYIAPQWRMGFHEVQDLAEMPFTRTPCGPRVAAM